MRRHLRQVKERTYHSVLCGRKTLARDRSCPCGSLVGIHRKPIDARFRSMSIARVTPRCTAASRHIEQFTQPCSHSTRERKNSMSGNKMPLAYNHNSQQSERARKINVARRTVMRCQLRSVVYENA